MSDRNDIHGRLRDLRARADAETHERILSDVLRVHAETRKAAPSLVSTLVRRYIMTRWIWKLSLAGVAVIVALVLCLPSGGGGLALADVLHHIQQSSYRFDLTIGVDNARTTVLGRVYQQGRARFDDKVGLGTVSTIVDLESRRSLLLFHQFHTARYAEESEELTHTGADELLLLCSRPIEDLWHLRDGSEEDLGEQTHDGRKAHGFRVVHEDEYFRNTVTLWADAGSAEPITVQIVSAALKPPGNEMTFTLANFVVDPNMDATPFSLEVPPGYTLADHTTLEDVTFAEDSSPEADKIATALQLGSEDKIDEAVATVLTVDWARPIVFAEEPYLFTLTEKNVIEFKQAERERVMAVVMKSCSVVRKICFALVDRAKAARAEGDHTTAEKALEAAVRLGELLNREPDTTLIAQLVGIAARKLALVQLKALYEEMNAAEKRVSTEQKIQQVDAEHQTIKNRAQAR
jgi:hypothetical protein